MWFWSIMKGADGLLLKILKSLFPEPRHVLIHPHIQMLICGQYSERYRNEQNTAFLFKELTLQ